MNREERDKRKKRAKADALARQRHRDKHLGPGTTARLRSLKRKKA